MEQYRKYNKIAGWVVFAIAAIVYLMTIEPTVSWWDPGEHIATSYKIQIGHPPGAPAFQLTARFFSLFAFGDTTKVALMINCVSALSSAFTILLLFWIITMIARKIVVPKGEEMTKMATSKILLAGFIGAMTFMFTDSFWFSAVEANVFAMSYFCTAVVIWAIFKWEEAADEKHNYRWLIFIAFMIGISIGVHLLNLLTIPALTLVYYFRKFKTTRKGIVISIITSFILLAFIMYILIPWIPKLAGLFELFFVNSFGLPFNSGTIIYFILFIGLIIWGLWYTRKQGKTVLNTIILCIAFLLIGYTSFVSLVIRSNAGTPINEDAPKDAISLVSFLNREQYGTWPFLYGQYYTAPVIDYADASPIYKKDHTSGKYVIIDERKGTIPVFDPRFTTIFPRMWSTMRKQAPDFYKEWGGPGVPVEVTRQDGKTETINKPTFAENLRFFFTYQVSWMYIRYFMWNFCGRQDDTQSFGGIKNGNWITGIPPIDKWRLGHAISGLPESIKARASHKYFMLPLLLGLFGFFYQLKKDYRFTLVVFFLFFMTGLAIVIFLNQQPFEPRERDYSYAGSFMAFSIWIGLGVLYLIDFLQEKLKMKEMMSVVIVAVASTLLVPCIVGAQNWHDHDRSGKYAARDYAANYLNACDKNALLVTNGDNDTFSLWYNQEVEAVRTDVRVVNLELSSGSWYIDQLFRRNYESAPVPFSMTPDQYQPGTNDVIIYYDMGVKGYVELKDLIDFFKSKSPETYLTAQSGEKIKFYPTKKIRITVNKENCIKYGIVPDYYRDRMVDTIYFTIKANQLYKNDIMLLDMIATSNWTRPIYFAAPSSVRHCFDVERYCYLEGWVSKFMPVKNDSTNYLASMGSIDAMGSYDILMHKCKWGNLSDPRVYVDPESLNNSMKPKMDFFLVSETLLEQGRKKEAADLVNLYLKCFPDPKFPYDMYNLPFAEIFYKSGDTLKANTMVKRISEICRQDLDYYHSFTGKEKENFTDDIQTSMEVLNRLKSMTMEFRQYNEAARIDSMMKMMR